MKVKDFIDFLKLPPNILAALSLVTGIILFVSDKVLSKLYMVDFRNNYGFIISIVFLISTAILIVFIVSFVFDKIKKKIENKKLKEAQIKYLMNAEQAKVKLIKEFIKDETHTLSIPMNNGLTSELSHFGIISLAGNTQPVDFGYDSEMYIKYFLQPWVINLINDEEKLQDKYKIKWGV